MVREQGSFASLFKQLLRKYKQMNNWTNQQLAEKVKFDERTLERYLGKTQQIPKEKTFQRIQKIELFDENEKILLAACYCNSKSNHKIEIVKNHIQLSIELYAQCNGLSPDSIPKAYINSVHYVILKRYV